MKFSQPFVSTFRYYSNLKEMILSPVIDKEESITNLFIVLDRDEEQIEDIEVEIKEGLANIGIQVDGSLENNIVKDARYRDDVGNHRTISIQLTIIPFTEEGSIEMVLMQAQSSIGENEKMIVSKAKDYIDDLLCEGIAKKYLNHKRLITKAKFSAMISAINPDKSTSKFNDLLTHNNWNESPIVDQHFKSIYDELVKESKQGRLDK